MIFKRNYIINTIKNNLMACKETISINTVDLNPDVQRWNLSRAIPWFFIFSMGRSGTHFLSHLLARDKSALIFHEPMRRDYIEYLRALNAEHDPSIYIGTIKKKFIQNALFRHKEVKIYVEINSNLRLHSHAIMATFPNVKGYFLIRDGRNVIRSMMSREIPYLEWITPPVGDPFRSRWNSWGKFEKCCWLWAAENEILHQQFGDGLKFELLIKDYKYLDDNLLSPLKIDIPRQVWDYERINKSDATTQFALDSYENWQTSQQQTFWEVCGTMMDRHEYAR